MRRQFANTLILLVIFLSLGGCFSGQQGFSSSGSSSTTTTSSTTATTTSASGVQIGNGTGSAFTQGTLSVAVTSLSAGGSTSVTANLVDSNNVPYTTAVDVTFSSTCTGLGTATITSPKTTVNGTAVTTYVAAGCTGTDTITATASVDGSTLYATGTVTVAAASAGSISFVSATPTVIALQGTGGTENSTVVFKVKDTSGGALAGQTVNFSLNTTVGGITLSSSSATSNTDGTVQTIVKSGTVNTSVRVTATIAATSIATQSDALAISTGVPDQNSFALSASVLNPEAWELNGVSVNITAFVSDHFNNPAPDGTAVAFQAEGGYIDGSCITTNGQCSVNWVSSAPRPSDGRVTVLASAIGEEGFNDVNGNGVFDGSDTHTDLAEAWRDDNEDDVRDATEEFLDYNVNGTYDAADGLYNGTLCSHATKCSSTTLLHVRDDIVLVMASVSQIIGIYDYTGSVKGAALTSITLPDSGALVPVLIEVMDARGQVPPNGTIIAGSVDIGKISGPSSTTVLNTNAPGPVSLVLYLKRQTSDQVGDAGSLAISLTHESGNQGGSVSIPVGIGDVTAPTVSSTTPAAGGTGFAVTNAVSAVFSEDMAAGTLTPTTFTLTEDPAGAATAVTGFVSYSPTDKKVVFLPSADLTAATVYQATLTTGVQDASGIPMSSNFSWTFKTQ